MPFLSSFDVDFFLLNVGVGSILLFDEEISMASHN